MFACQIEQIRTLMNDKFCFWKKSFELPQSESQHRNNPKWYISKETNIVTELYDHKQSKFCFILKNCETIIKVIEGIRFIVLYPPKCSHDLPHGHLLFNMAR